MLKEAGRYFGLRTKEYFVQTPKRLVNTPRALTKKVKGAIVENVKKYYHCVVLCIEVSGDSLLILFSVGLYHFILGLNRRSNQ